MNKLPFLEGQKQKAESLEFDWGPTVTATEEACDYRTCVWAARQLDRDFEGNPFFMAVGISKPLLAWRSSSLPAGESKTDALSLKQGTMAGEVTLPM